MDEQEKKKIRPLYNELQGYLSQAPTAIQEGPTWLMEKAGF
jgi:hypothetical protein